MAAVKAGWLASKEGKSLKIQNGIMQMID